jgi:uncharacterized membrane protein
MFDAFPSLFERNFAVGFFLPVVVFLVTVAVLLDNFGLLGSIVTTVVGNELQFLVATSIFAFIAWLGAILLYALNRDIIRFFEGYGRLNPLYLFRTHQVKRFTQLQRELEELDKQYARHQDKGEEIPHRLVKRRRQIMEELAESFPDAEHLVLPTRFGNIIRSFEVYPRVMYGIDAIPGWIRLLTVVPESFQNLGAEAKAQLDFWVNVRVLSVVTILLWLILAVVYRSYSSAWLPLVSLAVSLVAAHRADSAATQWGMFVKAAFDVYLPQLLENLSYERPGNHESYRSMWGNFSQAVIFRRPDLLPDLKGASQLSSEGETDDEDE